MIKRKVGMNVDKYHDSTMNNIEGLLNSLHNIKYLEYCDSIQYINMSEAIFKFYQAIECGNLEESE